MLVPETLNYRVWLRDNLLLRFGVIATPILCLQLGGYDWYAGYRKMGPRVSPVV